MVVCYCYLFSSIVVLVYDVLAFVVGILYWSFFFGLRQCVGAFGCVAKMLCCEDVVLLCFFLADR